jgi:hypothetical protein
MPDTNLVLFYSVPFGRYWPILAVEGAEAESEIDHAIDECLGNDIANFTGERDLPTARGFFVWEGSITLELDEALGDPPTYEPVWLGSVRPATVADLARLEVKLPKE